MCVCVRRRRGVTRIQQPEHSSQYQNQNLYAQYHYKRNRTGRYKSIFGAISKTTPISETCNMEMYLIVIFFSFLISQV